MVEYHAMMQEWKVENRPESRERSSFHSPLSRLSSLAAKRQAEREGFEPARA